MKITILSIILLVGSAFTMPADIQLVYKFKKGDLYEYSQNTKQATKQSIPGMGDVTIDATVDASMSMTIQEITNGNAKIEAKYTKMKMVVSSMMMNMNMDSEGSADDAQNKMVKSMMNKPFFFTMTNTGKIERVEGVDNVFSDFDKLGLDEATIANTKAALKQNLNDQSIKSSLENGFIQYPGKKVQQGETWNTSSTHTMGFAMKVDNAWSVTKFEHPVASVSADATMVTVDKEKIMSLPNGMKSKSDMNGRQAVIGKVDVNSGWPTEVKMLSELKGTMTLLAGGMIPEDMQIPMEMTIETSYNITKK